jgi:hypothetical protein
MSYIPKYILKRMFPKDEALQIVTYEGKKCVYLQAINVISPISVPDHIDLGPVKLPDDIGKYLKISINGKATTVTPDILVNKVSLWNGGKKHTFNSIFKENSAAGLTIAVGGKLTMLIEADAFPADIIAMMDKPGEIEVTVEVALDNPINVSVKVNLTKIGVAFDPANT